MKNILKLLVLVLSVSALASCGAASQASRAERAAAKEAARAAMVAALEKPDFKLDITRIIPRGFPSRVSTGEYMLRLKGDVVDTRLPFIGVSHEAAKGEYFYRFTGGKSKDKWTINLQVYDNGTANIVCTTSGGKYMSFFAEMVIPQENEEK